MVPRPPEVIQRLRLLEIEELRRPHLVLADFGRDVGVAVRASAHTAARWRIAA